MKSIWKYFVLWKLFFFTLYVCELMLWWQVSCEVCQCSASYFLDFGSGIKLYQTLWPLTWGKNTVPVILSPPPSLDPFTCLNIWLWLWFKLVYFLLYPNCLKHAYFRNGHVRVMVTSWLIWISIEILKKWKLWLIG